TPRRADSRRPVLFEREVLDDRPRQGFLFVADARTDRQPVADLPRVLDEARPVALRGVTRGVEIRARDAEDFSEGRIGQDRNLRAGRRLVARRRDERRTGPLIDLIVGQAVVVEPVPELVLAGAVEDA